jgi:hypothetical protein
MASLGQIARERGHISQAQGYLIDPLRIAIEEDALFPLNHALPGIALLFAEQIGEAILISPLATRKAQRIPIFNVFVRFNQRWAKRLHDYQSCISVQEQVLIRGERLSL